MARKRAFPQPGDHVEIAWGISTVVGQVLEVYGPPTSRHVLLAVDLGTEGDAEQWPTVSLPIDKVQPLSAAS